MCSVLSIALTVGALMFTVTEAGTTATYGPSAIPSTGGPAGCYLQILKTPVTQEFFCATQVAIHLNHGSETAPLNVYELRSYSINTVPSTPVATLLGVRNITLDMNSQDEQTVSVSPCLNISKGDYMGVTNRAGKLADTVASGGGSGTFMYWNRFSVSSSVPGSTVNLDSTFGPGKLGWHVIGTVPAVQSATTTTTMGPTTTTTSVTSGATSTTLSSVTSTVFPTTTMALFTTTMAASSGATTTALKTTTGLTLSTQSTLSSSSCLCLRALLNIFPHVATSIMALLLMTRLY